MQVPFKVLAIIHCAALSRADTIELHSQHQFRSPRTTALEFAQQCQTLLAPPPPRPPPRAPPPILWFLLIGSESGRS